MIPAVGTDEWHVYRHGRPAPKLDWEPRQKPGGEPREQAAVLRILRRHAGRPVSIERLSAAYAAKGIYPKRVDKAVSSLVRALRLSGHKINHVAGAGYILLSPEQGAE